MILGIYGSGGLGREVLDMADLINTTQKKWEKIIFINDFETDNKEINGVPAYTFNEIASLYSPDKIEIIIAVGEPESRNLLFNRVTEAGYAAPPIIHPSAVVSPSAKIGKGVVIQAFSFISCNTSIEENVFIQGNSIVGHDTIIRNNSVLSSHCVLAGHVSVGENTYIGLNVPVKENINIGDSVIIGMGSVVTRDIPDNVIALGNPARPMKNNDEKKVFK